MTPARWLLSLPPELPQILIVRRQDDAGPAARVVGGAVAEEARFVGLHRPVEVVEVRILAERLGVPKAKVRIVAGALSRRKIIEVEGIAAEAIRQTLGPNP